MLEMYYELYFLTTIPFDDYTQTTNDLTCDKKKNLLIPTDGRSFPLLLKAHGQRREKGGKQWAL